MGLKLFILIRRDLLPAAQGVQAGHAVAAWCAQFYRQGNYDPWDNGTLIYVTIRDLPDLVLWQKKIEQRAFDYQVFCEPDINGGEATTIACAVPKTCNLFDKLPLWDPVTSWVADNM